MLRKLFKYEFKESGGMVFPLLLGIFILSVVGRIIYDTPLYNALPDVLVSLYLTLNVIGVIGCAIGVPLFFIVRFQQTVYGTRGYLLHTLPVGTHQKMISKLITAFVIQFITVLVCGLCLCILLFEKNTFSTIKNLWVTGSTQFEAMTDMSLALFLVLVFVMLLVNSLAQTAMYFSCVSIGHLFHINKILGFILSYFILYAFNQIISSILMVILGVSNIELTSVPNMPAILAILGILTCFTLLQGAIYYLVSYYLIEKKLNLE